MGRAREDEGGASEGTVPFVVDTKIGTVPRGENYFRLASSKGL